MGYPRRGFTELPMSLGDRLIALLESTDAQQRLRSDPIRFVHRYRDDPRDAEVAAVFASQLAYGRVDLFGHVLEDLFGRMDAVGGPVSFVHGRPSAKVLAGLNYRWNRPADFAGMAAALSEVLRLHGSLERAFQAPDARQSIQRGVGALRDAAVATAPIWLGRPTPYSDLPRGLRYWLSTPSGGSACKRWNLFLRWMARPATDGVDLGQWRSPAPDRLVMPLDTHVHRLARFLGLTQRKTGNWKTAMEVTEAMRMLDPEDPVRFDFALAHLGISRDCRGGRVPVVCAACPLDRLCTAESLS